ncbi:MAG: membrane protein insertion efficiency factor YidD [Solirubrobacterales bacterium]
MQPLRSSARAIALAPIHVYRRVVSPFIAPRCRYYPTCSTYGLEAIRTYGVIRGSVLAAWRLVRCNPLSDGGFDYLDDQKIFKHRCDHDHSRKATAR